MAKGLLIVYNPHNLLEFIWYYHTNKEARELTWDALCLPSGPNGQYMAPYCEKCGIFENVFSDSFAYSDGPVLKQLTLFLKMFGYFIVGQRKRFCKKILNKYIDPDSYKQFAVLSDFGIVSGAVLGAGLNTVIFEDGAADYEPRKNSNIFGDILNPFRIKGFLLAKMGYSNSAYFYPLRTTKNCIKYNSYPDKVPYRKYKEIRKLFDFSDTDMDGYNETTQNLYADIKNIDFESVDTVVFTTDLKTYLNEDKECIKRLEDYLINTSESILIKKHPKDDVEYNLPGKTVQEVTQSIPAEVLLPYIKHKRVIFVWLSSIVLNMDSHDYSIICLCFEDLSKKSFKNPTEISLFQREYLERQYKKYGAEKIEFVSLY